MDTCRICGASDWRPAYQGPIRRGRMGCLTEVPRTVFGCATCGILWLPGEVGDAASYYRDGQYREELGQKGTTEDFESLHDVEVPYQLEMVPMETLRGKVVLDVGCGGGTFLDAVRGFARTTVGVEPDARFLLSLPGKGHLCFPDIETFLNSGNIRADVAVCFNVIEHVSDPLAFATSIRKSLADGGIAIFSTPNTDDFLLAHGPAAYKSFYFRKAHEWYFRKDSIAYLMKRAGFKEAKSAYQHSYGLSNAMLWMRDGKGHGRKDFLGSPMCDFAWKRHLIDTGRAERLYCTARS